MLAACINAPRALWTKAALGSASAAKELVVYLCQVSPGDTTRAAHWVADQADLDHEDPTDVARLLLTLRSVGATDTVQVLLARDPAAHARLDDPWGLEDLLQALRLAGVNDAVQALAARAAAHANLDDPLAVATLVKALREADASDAVRVLLARDPPRTSASPTRPVLPACYRSSVSPGR